MDSYENEKLPRLCFSCGRILNATKCHTLEGEDAKDQYRSWLRVDSQKHNFFSFLDVTKSTSPLKETTLTSQPYSSGRLEKATKGGKSEMMTYIDSMELVFPQDNCDISTHNFHKKRELNPPIPMDIGEKQKKRRAQPDIQKGMSRHTCSVL